MRPPRGMRPCGLAIGRHMAFRQHCYVQAMCSESEGAGGSLPMCDIVGIPGSCYENEFIWETLGLLTMLSEEGSEETKYGWTRRCKSSRSERMLEKDSALDD